MPVPESELRLESPLPSHVLCLLRGTWESEDLTNDTTGLALNPGSPPNFNPLFALDHCFCCLTVGNNTYPTIYPTTYLGTRAIKVLLI